MMQTPQLCWMDAVPDALILVDGSGEIVYANQRCEDILRGLTAARAAAEARIGARGHGGRACCGSPVPLVGS